jgi:polyisoprenoid-binding protein YceI
MSAPLLVQAAAAPAAPAGPSKDLTPAVAGTYNIDVMHSSVIARIPHSGGVSSSTMRFGVTKAALTWDPANVGAIKLDATVDAKPHYDPVVYRVTPESAQLLNVAQFPTANFVSTTVVKTGALKADVTGNLTLLGVTKPAVMHIELTGVGKNAQGAPILGFTGSMAIKRSDFGMTFLLPGVGDNVALTLDGEFIKAS